MRLDFLSAAAHGFTLASEDAWEWACGGVSTLFRWGNELPRVDEDPPGGQLDLTSVKPEAFGPNRFGLFIGDDPYECEFCRDARLIKGGDGGRSWHGAEGRFAIWRSLAIPFRLRGIEPLHREAKGRRVLILE
jgi:hypothetical protein